MSELATLIQKAAGTFREGKMYIMDAKVLSVDLETRTCEVETIDGKSSNLLSVRLMAAVDDGALIIPVVGSTVVVMFSEFVTPLVLMYSEVARIVWLGGEYDGVPIVTHPTNANKGLLKKINDLENIVNEIIVKFNTHTHILTLSAGVGTAAVTTTQQATNISPITIESDISHPNITH